MVAVPGFLRSNMLVIFRLGHCRKRYAQSIHYPTEGVIAGVGTRSQNAIQIGAGQSGLFRDFPNTTRTSDITQGL
ncbi:hypothetical protein D3C87_1657020 [compost metagenome]